MTAQILDGEAIAKEVRAELKEKVSKLSEKPSLAAVIVGENPASKIYISAKEKACAEVGIEFEKHELPEDTPQDELISLIQGLKTTGVMVQLPLPEHLDERIVLDSIPVEKDVDGLTSFNLGKVLAGEKGVIPATPKGIVRLIEKTGVELKGKNATIIGHSNIVGKPLSMLLVNKFATVTLCHIYSQPIERFTKDADVLIVAVGKSGLINADIVKEGAVVIDVGINRDGDKVVGDVSSDVKEKASWISPVPGGVGPMTVAMLLENLVELL